MKKTLVYLYLSILNVLFLNAQVNLNTSLTACYALNGNASDAINSLHGQMSNLSPAADRFNTSNKALSFNELNGSLIELPNSTLLKSKAISFSAWVKPAIGFGAERYILMAATNSLGISLAAYSLFLNDLGSGKNFVVEKCNASNLDFVNTSNVFLNTWYHVAFTADSASLNIYLNGVLQQSVATAVNLVYDATKKVYLGGTGEATHPAPFSGLIDNVRFYNRIISAAEVNQLYLNDPSCVVALAPPSASFSLAVPHCVGNQIQFTDLSLNNSDTWIWQAPGAIVTNSLDPNPICTYTAAGVYTIGLDCSNSLGSSNASVSIVIHPLPILSIIPSSTFCCRGMNYTLTASGAQNYSWTTALSGTTILNTGSNLTFNALNTTTYSVFGLDTNGCEATKSIQVKVATCEIWGISEVKKSDLMFTVFPNPGTNIIKVELSEGIAEAYILRDIFGKVILHETEIQTHDLKIDLSELSKGIYFLQVNSQGKSGIRKIVKD